MNFTFNAAALANPGSWFPWARSSSTVTSPAATQTAQADQHALANRQLVKLPNPLGQLIVCTAGTLWVTVDGETKTTCWNPATASSPRPTPR